MALNRDTGIRHNNNIKKNVKNDVHSDNVIITGQSKLDNTENDNFFKGMARLGCGGLGLSCVIRFKVRRAVENQGYLVRIGNLKVLGDIPKKNTKLRISREGILNDKENVFIKRRGLVEGIFQNKGNIVLKDIRKGT